MSWAAHRQDSQFLTMALGTVETRTYAAIRRHVTISTLRLRQSIMPYGVAIPKTLRILLKAGADLEARNSAGWTPLMEAASQCAYDVMYLLLEAGADFRAKDENGYPVSSFLLRTPSAPRVSCSNRARSV